MELLRQMLAAAMVEVIDEAYVNVLVHFASASAWYLGDVSGYQRSQMSYVL